MSALLLGWVAARLSCVVSLCVLLVISCGCLELIVFTGY